MSQHIVQVDAFTDRPFSGNPAAVCIMDEAADAGWMQNVALEMNLSETAFLYPIDSGFHLRWFTPVTEVELCGHATLASAHTLYEDGHVSPDRSIHFQTLSGELVARKTDDGIELDFPAGSLTAADTPAVITEALRVEVMRCVQTGRSFLAELASDETLVGLTPNFSTIRKIGDGTLIVTALSSRPEVDFVSRFFAPGMGIDEDPVTGYAHTQLGPYWKERLGRSEFRAHQASPRGGYLKVRVDGDRVFLAGRAITVMRGELI